MDKFIQFLKARLNHFTDFQVADEISDKWEAALRLFEPCLPRQFRHFGDFEYFPPVLQKDECCVIVLNHVSDLDWCILMFLMHNTYLKRDVKSRTDQQVLSEAPHKTIYPTAFTHKHFEDVYFIGETVKAHLITLYKGITEEEMMNKIKQRMTEGVNCFILFPCGRIHSKENHADSQEFWSTKVEGGGEYPFKNVLCPKSGCWTALIKAIGPKLKYICDLSLLYPNYEPWLHSWNYDSNPSVVHSYTFGRLNVVFTHTRIYELKMDEWKTWMKPDSVLSLWKKKEKRLEWLREQEIKWNRTHKMANKKN